MPAVALLTEGGFDALSMESVATRAGVGKATVYRRWPSPTQLAAESFQHAGLVADPSVAVLGTGRLRDELFTTLVDTTRCTHHRAEAALVATMFETNRRHPEVAEALQQRYLDNIFTSVLTVLRNAAQRGDIPAQQLLETDVRPIQIQASIALILHWQIIGNHDLTTQDIEAVVDGILLPAFSSTTVET